MEYEGMMWRPPSEAESFILQVTVGCANNTCTFCTMYHDVNFRVRSPEEIFADIDEVANSSYGSYYGRVFLASGDALVMPTEQLLAVLHKIYVRFPNVSRVSAYATAKDIVRKTPEELSALREAGLKMVYMGVESGSDTILRYINKKVTAQDIIEASAKLKQSGIKNSVTLISGLGGKARWEEHALSSARIISVIKPEFCSFLALQIFPETPLYDEIKNGSFQPISDEEIIDEMLLFLENVDSDGTVFRSNHVSNIVPLRGTFNRDIPVLCKALKTAKAKKDYGAFSEPVL